MIWALKPIISAARVEYKHGRVVLIICNAPKKNVSGLVLLDAHRSETFGALLLVHPRCILVGYSVWLGLVGTEHLKSDENSINTKHQQSKDTRAEKKSREL